MNIILFSVALLGAALLTGCSGTAERGQLAAVEDKSTSELYEDELEIDIDVVETQGVGDSAGFEGSPLDEPGSVLAERVIYFEYDSSEVLPRYRGVVEAHAAYLARTPGALVVLEGHTDERGTREYNLALGERRAESVRRQLVLLGASAGQVRSASFGEESPAVVGTDESSRAKNRRVELKY